MVVEATLEIEDVLGSAVEVGPFVEDFVQRADGRAAAIPLVAVRSEGANHQ
jgi:hypothetical protein